MLKHSVIVIFLITFLFADSTAVKSKSGLYDEKRVAFVFKNAMKNFRYGSYYQALDEFSYVAKFPQSPYYLSSLFMLAHTYLYIGKRVGDKNYFWSALNYLNLYLARGGEKNYKFYTLKAQIYENLGFYERAFALYKMALAKAAKKSEKLPIVMGLLRTAVWLQRIDLATKYLLILSIESLSKEQKKEFTFLQGMYYFAKKEYQKALEYFKQTYKDFESFLIDNPSYYYFVAETAYRNGDLKFAQMLFRRILNYIKNREVVQKSLLRLGDIKFLQKDYHGSVNYYIRLIKTFPDTDFATIAKLKLLFIIKKDKNIRYYIKKYMPDAPFLQDPLHFIVQTLVKYRNSYIGIFALANFGMESFEIGSKKLYKRLSWELSLLPSQKLKFEQKEYFRRLWKDYINNAKNASYICMLYEANPDFFYRVFDTSTLYNIAAYLHKCQKEMLRLELLAKIYSNHPDQKSVVRYVEALYENKKFAQALQILQKYHFNSCSFLKLYAKVCFIAEASCEQVYKDLVRYCAQDELYRDIFTNILLMRQNRLDTTFLVQKRKILATSYVKDEVVKKFVQLFAQKLLEKERYNDLIKLLSPLASSIQSDCFLNSILSLSYVRIGKIKYARQMLKKAKGCKNSWYTLAKLAIEDSLLQQEIKGNNVGEN